MANCDLALLLIRMAGIHKSNNFPPFFAPSTVHKCDVIFWFFSISAHGFGFWNAAFLPPACIILIGELLKRNPKINWLMNCAVSKRKKHWFRKSIYTVWYHSCHYKAIICLHIVIRSTFRVSIRLEMALHSQSLLNFRPFGSEWEKSPNTKCANKMECY